MRKKETAIKKSYLENLFANDNDVLQQIIAYNDECDVNRNKMQISYNEGQILKLMIEMNNIKNIVEIGTLSGFSTLYMAYSLPEDGSITTLDINQESYELANSFFRKTNVAYKITSILGDARKELYNLDTTTQFDMIFIDGDKASYPLYLDWAEKSIKKGGLIIADNTLLFNTVYHKYGDVRDQVKERLHSAMNIFNQRLADKNKYSSVMLPTQEGMTVSIKKF